MNKSFRKACSAIVAACLVSAPAIAGPMQHADPSEKRFSRYMKKNDVTRVCADVRMGTDGVVIISKSSGNASTDAEILVLMRGKGVVADMIRSAVEARGEPVVAPVEFDDSQYRPDGAHHCYAAPQGEPDV